MTCFTNTQMYTVVYVAHRAGGISSRSYVARVNMISLDYANVRGDLVGAGRCFGE